VTCVLADRQRSFQLEVVTCSGLQFDLTNLMETCFIGDITVGDPLQLLCSIGPGAARRRTRATASDPGPSSGRAVIPASKRPTARLPMDRWRCSRPAAVRSGPWVGRAGAVPEASGVRVSRAAVF
jgi:hypothetical protein